jgi:hypothetical protein
MSDIVKRARDMHALAVDSCDPAYNRILLEMAAELERLEAILSKKTGQKAMLQVGRCHQPGCNSLHIFFVTGDHKLIADAQFSDNDEVRAMIKRMQDYVSGKDLD